jgi:hypothetical protein
VTAFLVYHHHTQQSSALTRHSQYLSVDKTSCRALPEERRGRVG